MKRQLEPVWTKSQLKAGQQMSQAWEAFFSAAEQQGEAAKDAAPGLADDAKVDEIVRRHEAVLLGYSHVVGVAKGLRIRQGRPSGEPEEAREQGGLGGLGWAGVVSGMHPLRALCGLAM